jgi:hypothetical protein
MDSEMAFTKPRTVDSIADSNATARYLEGLIEQFAIAENVRAADRHEAHLAPTLTYDPLAID